MICEELVCFNEVYYKVRPKEPKSIKSIRSTVCMFLSCHVRVSEWMHTYSCLNVKELLARSRREIWSLSDCNWTRTHNHLVWPVWLNGWVFVYELSGCGSSLVAVTFQKYLQRKAVKLISYSYHSYGKKWCQVLDVN